MITYRGLSTREQGSKVLESETVTFSFHPCTLIYLNCTWIKRGVFSMQQIVLFEGNMNNLVADQQPQRYLVLDPSACVINSRQDVIVDPCR